MNRLNAGFFMVEILLSLVLITGFVVLCMRYQAQSLALQVQAIDTMEVIDRIEAALDDIKTKNIRSNNSNCKFNYSRTVESVTIPTLQGNPSTQHMKVMTITASWKGQSGQQLCRLPMIFKEDIYGLS